MAWTTSDLASIAMWWKRKKVTMSPQNSMIHGTTTIVVVLSTMLLEMVRTTNSITVEKVPLMGDPENVAIVSNSISRAWEIAVVPIIGVRGGSVIDFDLELLS
jgi:hypothetical protein